MAEIVKGKQVTVRFDASLCVHSRNCVLSHPEVFVPNVKGDWIHPDDASVETVMRIAFNCPSGAIHVTSNEGTGTSEEPPIVNTVRVRENGPLALEGELQHTTGPGSGDSVSLRGVQEQAVLRWCPRGGKLHRNRRTERQGATTARSAQWPD